MNSSSRGALASALALVVGDISKEEGGWVCVRRRRRLAVVTSMDGWRLVAA